MNLMGRLLAKTLLFIGRTITKTSSNNDRPLPAV